MPHLLSSEMRERIADCSECHNICVETITHCLETGGKNVEASHIRMVLDCAQICVTSADFMLRGSDLHRQTRGVCADACVRCTDECERLIEDDKLTLRCSQVCRRCAESCRQMAA
jgi:hypothetical protein